MAFQLRSTDRYVAFIATVTPSLTLGYAFPRELGKPGRASHVDPTTIVQYPVFLSPNRTIAKEWIVTGLLSEVSRPVEMGNTEYVNMIGPDGLHYVYGLNNDGTWYIELFDSGVPYDRRVTSTVMHKGQRLWVADPRQKPPTGGF